jgi:cilla- and flagella-associated protein
VSFLKNLPNLEVLALTVNQLTTLQDFTQCFKLRELYLRRNNIPPSLSQIHFLSGLNNLTTLNMSENPITTLPNYRLMVLKYLPRLEKLDDVEVSYQELELAREIDIQQMINDGQLDLTDKSNVTPIKSAKKSFV